MQPKLKLLKILDILRETDSTHPITAPSICTRLAEMGIKAERKSVCRDINTLIEYGCKIVLCHDNKLGYYMLQDEGASPPKPVTLDLVHITVEYKKEDGDTVRSIMGQGEETEEGEYIVAEYSVPSSNLFENLFTLGTVMKLTAPTELKEEFEERLSEVADYYKRRRDTRNIDFWLL